MEITEGDGGQLVSCDIIIKSNSATMTALKIIVNYSRDRCRNGAL